MKSLREMLTNLFTKTNLEPAVEPVREAGARDADLLFDAYEGGFRDRLAERFHGTVTEFTGAELPAIETTATTRPSTKSRKRAAKK